MTGSFACPFGALIQAQFKDAVMEFYLARRGEGKDDAPKTLGRPAGLWCYGALLEMAAKHILHTVLGRRGERRKEREHCRGAYAVTHEQVVVESYGSE